MLVGVVFMSRLYWGNKGGKAAGTVKETDAYEKSNALLTDVILNFKTVISFGDKNVVQIIKKFEGLLIEPSERRIRNAHAAGIAFGYS
jgi:ABC-type transport system involved in Fe-S cluster assembly fused permease/ATPase subunit